MQCYCCSGLTVDDCCGPLLKGQEVAASPEQLMRSRFSAYCCKQYDYVLATYSDQAQQTLSVAELANSATGCEWFALTVHDCADTGPHQVEFTAFYVADRSVQQLHETSNFLFEHQQWRYHDGILHDDCGPVRIERNAPCPCLSGKKFKQCCQRRFNL